MPAVEAARSRPRRRQRADAENIASHAGGGLESVMPSERRTAAKRGGVPAMRAARPTDAAVGKGARAARARGRAFEQPVLTCGSRTTRRCRRTRRARAGLLACGAHTDYTGRDPAPRPGIIGLEAQAAGNVWFGAAWRAHRQRWRSAAGVDEHRWRSAPHALVTRRPARCRDASRSSSPAPPATPSSSRCNCHGGAEEQAGGAREHLLQVGRSNTDVLNLKLK